MKLIITIILYKYYTNTLIVKLISTENYNNRQIEISIKNVKHFSLQFVELVNNFV